MNGSRLDETAFWREQVTTHWASGWAALRATPWPVWFIPIVAVLAILAIGATSWRWVVEKEVQETVSPTIVALTLTLAVLVWRWVPETMTRMAALLVFALFLRELHFGFTNWAIYFALAALVWWFSMERKNLTHYLSDFWLRLWLGGTFLNYAVADAFDGHVWQFLPGYWTFNDIAEETLETVGHVQLFLLICMVARLATARRGGQA
jgi:hypothetical protein